MSDAVSSAFAERTVKSPRPASVVGSRCIHCLNPWGRVVREVFEGMLEGTVPIELTVVDIHRRMVGFTPEQCEQLGMPHYRRSDGQPPAVNTLRNHIQTHEWELWVRARKAELGCRW